MPTFTHVAGKRKRERVDCIALVEWFALQSAMGVDRAVIELVSGRPQQSAGAGFVFGAAYGMVYASAVAACVPIEIITSQEWKRKLRVPGKQGGNEAIIKRADELLPNHRHWWRGPKGGLLVDRCEAAMLAWYGETL